MTRDEVQIAARRYVEKGTKWRHIGRSERALDCAGLLLFVAHDLGCSTVKDKLDNYRRTPEGEKFVAHLMGQFVLPPVPVEKPGSIVVLRHGTSPCHCGILGMKYGSLTLIHSSAERGGVCEEAWDNGSPTAWRRTLRCILDFPGVEG